MTHRPLITLATCLALAAHAAMAADEIAAAKHRWAQSPHGAMLERMTTEIGLSEVIAKSTELLDGRLRGRTVVDVGR